MLTIASHSIDELIRAAVTSGEMNPSMRFISDMKDAVGYFGLRGLFGGGKRKPAQ